PSCAWAGESVDPRNPADVYERNKTSMKDVFAHVASDLRARAEQWPKAEKDPAPGGVLIVVVDPTTSMKAEMLEMREALIEAVATGPKAGLRVGVLGAGAEWTPPGHVGQAVG